MSNSTASRGMSNIDYTDLSTHVDACLHELIDRGYAKRTIDRYRCGLDHFSRWVTRDRTPWNREEELVRRFLSSHLHVCDRLHLSAALRHFSSFPASPRVHLDSYARVFRAALSTSAIATPSKSADLLWTLCKDEGRAP
jgi:hypothetical protein